MYACIYIYIYILSYRYNYTKSAVFCSKISIILILILYNSLINNKSILRDLRFRHNIACFCFHFANKKLFQTATALLCVSEQHDDV